MSHKSRFKKWILYVLEEIISLRIFRYARFLSKYLQPKFNIIKQYQLLGLVLTARFTWKGRISSSGRTYYWKNKILKIQCQELIGVREKRKIKGWGMKQSGWKIQQSISILQCFVARPTWMWLVTASTEKTIKHTPKWICPSFFLCRPD